MTPENKKILDELRPFHTSLAGPAQTLRGLNQHQKNDLLNVARAEFFGQGYSPDLWCPQCVADFIMNIYRAYDNWLSQQPAIVATGFPSNKD